VAVIVADGLRRMYADQEDVFYYVTVMNENYQHPSMPEGREDAVRDGIVKGMYLFREGKASKKSAPRVQLLGSGTILNEVIAAADLLEQDWNVAADVWSAPSFTELGRDGMAAERWNMLHPDQERRQSYVEAQLADRPDGPVVAATDYIRTFAEQIRPYVKRRYRVLGTDGFGRSDYRRKLREFFEVDRHFITVAALNELAAEGTLPASAAAEAITKYGVNPDKPDPAHA
jgi:pyruvate dehydrogenase E1 component